MLNPILVIARKEISDSLRDVRSVVSSVLYALMGPFVVGLVSMGLGPDAKNVAVLAGMMSVFTLVAAFVGGMNVAMDTIAGERERRSLLPLLLNPVSRMDIAVGKWLAVSFFAVGGFILNLLGFSLITAPHLSPVILIGILPLPFLAASVQVLISTLCRAIKEAQTYLSMVVFLPMMIGMFLVFFPGAQRAWWGALPLVGQQIQLELIAKHHEVPLVQPVALGFLTLITALLILLVAANRLHRDEIIYGS